MKNGQKSKGVIALYQCNTCFFVLKQKWDVPTPTYCPNCKIHRMEGRMVLLKRPEEGR